MTRFPRLSGTFKSRIFATFGKCPSTSDREPQNSDLVGWGGHVAKACAIGNWIQFTSIDFIKALKDANIQISMDGKGTWRDNVFVERLWRTIKYEEVYLRAYNSVSLARESLGRYLAFYNSRRPHSSLDGQTPDQAYLNTLPPIQAAA